MSSPAHVDSPTQDDHAKRKRDEKDSVDKQTEAQTSEAESVPPKKIKPEVEGAVTKAEVKQIQRNLKTMPLEDGRQPQDDGASKDMDDVESDNGSNGSRDRPLEDRTMDDSTKPDAEDLESSTSDLGDLPSEGSVQPDQEEISRPTSADQKSPASSESSTPKLGGGFSNTSTVSPFATVTSTNVFGSSSSTLKGLSATSTASPFAAVDKSTNVFDKAPSTSLSGGFGNTSSVSPFATMAGSTNVFGEPAKSVFDESPKSVFGEPSKSVFGESSSKSVFGESSKSVFGESSKSVFGSTSSSGFGSFGTPEETTGSVFGSKSVLGSTTSSGPQSSSLAPVATFASSNDSKSPSPAPTSTFGTFGAKQSFLSKESSFASGSFIEQGASQDQEDFDTLLTQEGDNDGENEDQEENDTNFGTGIFSNADQVDVHTGEEDELTMYVTKGKLFADADKSQTWKERGKGTFKINVGRKNTKSARLVMRTDGALRLILNVAVIPNMNVIITGDKYIRFVGIEEGKPVLFLLKVKDVTVANEVVHAIDRAQDRQLHSGKAVALKE
ncbi:hypothetical protein BGZ93_008092 [Podila epicladia]|nr:hypothetical protein BGZ92_004918 [Podila epicladia]KAG0092951.1 hypothetical protein BGZ93_008092 [Podila epicladia]